MESLYSLVGISRQGHWESVKRQLSIRELERFYVGLMLEIRIMHPGMGLRKMHDQFQPEGIGRDAWIALGLREGFRLAYTKNAAITTVPLRSNKYSNLLDNKKFTNVNQVWVSDIFYFPIEGQHYYGILLMDVYSRKILGYSVADNMRAENNQKCLMQAFKERGIEDYKNELIHHSDRGTQYLSDKYIETLQKRNVQISVCFDVLENAHCERVNGTIKNEYLNRYEITNFKQLEKKMAEAVDNYNNRLHNTLKMTPNEFEKMIIDYPDNKRYELEIFTINQIKMNPFQLELF
jgi:putative transposase